MMKKLPYLLLLLLLAGCAPESDFEKYKEHVKKRYSTKLCKLVRLIVEKL